MVMTRPRSDEGGGADLTERDAACSKPITAAAVTA